MRKTISNVLGLFMTAFLVGCATTADRVRTFEKASPEARNKIFQATLDRFAAKANAELSSEIKDLELVLRSKSIREEKSRPVTRYRYSCIEGGKRSSRSSPFGTDCVQESYQSSEYYYESRKITSNEESRLKNQYERASGMRSLLARVSESRPLINYVIVSRPNDLEMQDRINGAYQSMLDAKSFADADVSTLVLSNGLTLLCLDAADKKNKQNEDADPRLINLCDQFLKRK